MAVRHRKRNRLRRVVDVCLLVLLLCLMSYQVTGEEKHEWTGVTMTLTVIVHQLLNRRWYAALFRGRTAAPAMSIAAAAGTTSARICAAHTAPQDRPICGAIIWGFASRETPRRFPEALRRRRGSPLPRAAAC